MTIVKIITTLIIIMPNTSSRCLIMTSHGQYTVTDTIHKRFAFTYGNYNATASPQAFFCLLFFCFVFVCLFVFVVVIVYPAPADTHTHTHTHTHAHAHAHAHTHTHTHTHTQHNTTQHNTTQHNTNTTEVILTFLLPLLERITTYAVHAVR